MKVIDIIKGLADGKEIPHFIIDEQEYYVGDDGYLKEVFGDDVEWTLDYEWLNQKVEVIEEEKEIKKINLNDNGTLGFPNGCWTARNMDKAFAIKINELIDEIKKLKESK